MRPMADKNQSNYLLKGVIGPVYKLGSLRPNELTRARAGMSASRRRDS